MAIELSNSKGIEKMNSTVVQEAGIKVVYHKFNPDCLKNMLEERKKKIKGEEIREKRKEEIELELEDYKYYQKMYTHIQSKEHKDICKELKR